MISMTKYIRESIDNIILQNLKTDSRDWIDDIQGNLDKEVPEEDIVRTLDKMKSLFGRNISKWSVGSGVQYRDIDEYWDKVREWAGPISKKYGLDVDIVSAIGYVMNGL